MRKKYIYFTFPVAICIYLLMMFFNIYALPFLILFTLFLSANIINSIYSIFRTDNSNVMGIAIIASVIYLFMIGRNLFLILFSVLSRAKGEPRGREFLAFLMSLVALFMILPG